MEINEEVHDENFIFRPDKFLDCIHNVNNTTEDTITASVPTASDIFYRRKRGKYILRSPEYEFYSDARILIRNISDGANGRVLLKKPEGFEAQVIFRDFELTLLPKTAYYLHVQSTDHVTAKDKSKALLEFYLISKLILGN